MKTPISNLVDSVMQSERGKLSAIKKHLSGSEVTRGGTLNDLREIQDEKQDFQISLMPS
jgi:hypothetical protein